MYQHIIKNYLDKLTIQDIIDYAKKKEGLTISKNDANYLLNTAKKDYVKLLNGEEDIVFQNLKNELEPETYKIAYKLFIEAKIKYLK